MIFRVLCPNTADLGIGDAVYANADIYIYIYIYIRHIRKILTVVCWVIFTVLSIVPIQAPSGRLLRQPTVSSRPCELF